MMLNLKRRSDTARNVIINFYSRAANPNFAVHAINVLEQAVAKLEKDFPGVLDTSGFSLSCPQTYIDIEGIKFRQNSPGDIHALWRDVQDQWPDMKDIIKAECIDLCLYDCTEVMRGASGKATDFRLYMQRDTDYSNHYFKAAFTLCMRPDIYQKCFQKEIIDLCEQGATMISAVGGYSDYTNNYTRVVFSPTPMQKLNDVEWEYHQEHSHEFVPGYDWCVLLTEEHIRRLGGKEAILRGAPCYQKHVWSINGKEAIFLQLTEDILNITDEERLAFKRFLEPVMLPIDPLTAAVEETMYKKKRMANVVFLPEEREIIDELESKYTAQELNQKLIARAMERQKQDGIYVPPKTKKEMWEQIRLELKILRAINKRD